MEAIACETPVIASAISPLDELLPLGQLFDPSDSHQIAAAITTALTKTEQPPHAAIQSWEEVGERTALSFERLLAAADRTKSHRSLRRARPRIAVITPLPPAATGVAQYSYRFIEAMVATEKVDVTCFSDGPTPDQTAPPGTVLHRVEALQHVEYLTGRFDEVIYVLGNSHHHLGAFAMLKKRRGIVMSHDVRLVNLYRHVHGDPGLVPGGLGREIEQMYEHLLPSSLGSGGELSEGDLDRYGLLMARDVIAMSAAFFVTSAAAVTLATIDAQSGTEHHIYALPFAMEEPRIDLPGFEHSTESRPGALEQLPLDLWGLAPPPDAVSYLAHFGIVDPIKRPELLIESIAGLSERPELRLVFVGPISEVMSKQLVDVAIELGVLDRVGFTGPLDPTSYRAWLKSAQIAIQLRAKSNGEASAAVGECLATSLATIVSDTGWSGEIPRDVVRHVPVSISADELAQVVAELLDDPLLRTDLGRASARYCEQHSFDTAARTMLQLIGEH